MTYKSYICISVCPGIHNIEIFGVIFPGEEAFLATNFRGKQTEKSGVVNFRTTVKRVRAFRALV